jgi:hypothetical protein
MRFQLKPASTDPRDHGNQPLLFSIALGLITILIWSILYHVQFLAYDENYGALIQAFLLSSATLIWIVIITWRNPQFIRKCWWQTLGFMLLASPFTVIILATNYKAVFGAAIQL